MDAEDTNDLQSVEAKIDELFPPAASLQELLGSKQRDYVVDSEGKNVPIHTLTDKIIALCFAAPWFKPFDQVSVPLHNAYNACKAEGKPFEVVAIPIERNEEFIKNLQENGFPEDLLREAHADGEAVGFREFVKESLPWALAIPAEDRESVKSLSERYRIEENFISVVLVKGTGELLNAEGLQVIGDFGVEAYPFSEERVEEMNEEVIHYVQADESIENLLAVGDRDSVLGKNGKTVKIESLKGIPIALYLSAHWCPPCRRFTPLLAGVYNELKEAGKPFEVVFVSSDHDQGDFDEYYSTMPWLAIPFSDSKLKRLINGKFEVRGIPTLVLLDSDGKVVTKDGVDWITEHGAKAYPFTEEQINAIRMEKERSQTLMSLLANDDNNVVIDNKGQETAIQELNGKVVGLYFSAHWCPPCRQFTPKLASIYLELKEQNKNFEVVFISSDEDEEAFREYHETMPWLALPFSQQDLKQSLSAYFKIEGIPTLVLLNENGKTITLDGREAIEMYGPSGFPFTREVLEKLEEEKDEEMTKLPQKGKKLQELESE